MSGLIGSAFKPGSSGIVYILFLARLAWLLKAGLWAIYVLLLFLVYFLFNNSCQTNYLKIYQTDLLQICRDLKLVY